MASLDRFGGDKAADAYYNALDAARERELRNSSCEECRKYHACPIPTKLGFCVEVADFIYGDTTPHELGCQEFERC